MTPCILIIEDDPMWRNKFKDIVTQEPIACTVELAGNRQEAKGLLEKSNVTLILLDLCLDGTNSPTLNDQLFWEFLKSEYPTLPVVAITGWKADRDKVFEMAQAENLPFVEFAYKGHFDLEKFRRRIRKVLSKNDLPSSPQPPEEREQDNSHNLRTQLYQWLKGYFNQTEIRTLCFEMDIPYDELPGEGASAKAQDLVEYCRRHNRLEELEEKIKSIRPFLR